MERCGEVGLELIYGGVKYVLVKAEPLRLMTGFRGNVCEMCQLDEICSGAGGYTRAMHVCGCANIFVKKLEV